MLLLKKKIINSLIRRVSFEESLPPSNPSILFQIWSRLPAYSYHYFSVDYFCVVTSFFHCMSLLKKKSPAYPNTRYKLNLCIIYLHYPSSTNAVVYNQYSPILRFFSGSFF